MTTFTKLWAELENLHIALDGAREQTSALTRDVHEELRLSAENLIDYLSLRQLDLRPLQFELERRGLSSLGRMEGHVRDAVSQLRERVRDALHREAHGSLPHLEAPDSIGLSCDESEQMLHRHTHAILGPRPRGRHIYVMVTAPSAAEVDDAWVARLLEAGMNVLRVNGAHEGPVEWRRIVDTARRVASSRGASLRVLVDLPGPKLRTVALRPGPQVVRFKPKKNALGQVVEPVEIDLFTEEATSINGARAALRVPHATLMSLAPGDELVLRDARGRHRRLAVALLPSRRLVAYCRRTVYLVPGIRVEQRRAARTMGEFEVGALPEQPEPLRLKLGDRFWLKPSGEDQSQDGSDLPVIGCSSHDALQALQPRERVVFDDGKLECVAEERRGSGMILRVIQGRAEGTKLGYEKGINLPDTELPHLSFSSEDEQALAFAKSAADMVGLSFIRDAESVRELYRRLEDAKPGLGVVLKIETASAFRQLPQVLLAAMTRYPLAVMIARGDLAVEVGFQRLAEVQEELLWICEAAHLPVIWATEVLAQLARNGVPTRAEVTDAAMSVRAECVMLNKGAKIDLAVSTLIDILRRMEHHQYKKRSLYRKLGLGMPATQPKAPTSDDQPTGRTHA